MQTLLDVILPVFLVIGFGYVSVWRGLFPQSGIDGVLKFGQSFGIPSLLFLAIAKLDLSTSIDPRLLFSFYTGAAVSFTLGIVGARLLKRDWEDCVSIGFCCLFSNSILLGLPISERAYGADALAGNYAIIAIHAPFCYGLGITVMEFVRNRGQSGLTMTRNIARAMFSNALVLAIIAGFAVNLTSANVPTVIMDALELIARAALPAALFALGGVLVQYRPEGETKAVVMICFIGLIIHPAIMWTMGTAFALPQDALRSGVITAAMAPGINVYVFANMYGRAKRVVATSLLMSTGMSIFSVWVWLAVLG